MRGSVVKRGKNFAAVVYLGRDPHTGKDRQRWASFKTRREAEAYLAQVVAQVQGGGVIPSTKLRVAGYLESWLRDYAEGAVAPTTLVRYQHVVRKRLVPAFGHLPLTRLSAQTIQGFLTATLKTHAAATVRYYAVVLHEALRHAVKWGLLARNPADFIERPRVVRQEMRVWDEEQVRLFLAKAKRSSAHYRLYLAALTTGMRQGELLGLRWRDVDLTLGEARITQTFYRLAGRPLFKEPKTARARRTVTLPNVLTEELRLLRGEQEERQRLLGGDYRDADLIFCQLDGKPLHAGNVVARDFRRTTTRAGVPRIRFHDLRHCHATLLLVQGTHPKVVQERLGHATPGFTLQVYSHVLPGMQAQATRLLEERLFGGANDSASARGPRPT